MKEQGSLARYVKSAKVLEARKDEARLEIVLDLDLLARDLAERVAESLRWCAGEAEAVAKTVGQIIAGLPKSFLQNRQAEFPTAREGSRAVPLTEEGVKAYLDEAIDYWRNQRDQEGENKIVAPYYVDAFQSIRKALFGEMKE